MTGEQLRELQRWASGLARDGDSADLRAAGRAILMLADELERRGDDGPAVPGGDPPPAAQTRAVQPTPLHETEPEDGGVAGDADGGADDDPVARRRVERRDEERRRSRRRLWRLSAVGAAAIALAGAGIAVAGRAVAPDLAARGPAETTIGKAALATLEFSVAARDGVRWTVDGRPVRASRREGRLVVDGKALPEGEHVVEARANGPLPRSTARAVWRIRVDTTPPVVRFSPERAQFTRGQPLELAGSLERGARVWVAGKELPVENGRFLVKLKELPRKPLTLRAQDAAGNVATRKVRPTLTARRPGGPIRAVHVTAAAWAAPFLRNPILQLIREKRINAVQLDLKDEAGIVGYDSQNPVAKRIGAVGRLYDLEQAVRQLHKLGVRVIGRLVVFRDPIYAPAAWEAGRRDEVVQTPDGAPYAGYGGFTNIAHPAVWKYNIELAQEAANAGVDEILYDYIRRPDGPISTMRFPGLKGTPEQAIVDFLKETRRGMTHRDVYIGVSVFGVAATRPLEVAQDIPAIAREVDYIAPMVYPSHWGPGEYGVANPNAQPYDITLASLRDFQRLVRGTGARIVPWLQDFTLGVTYGPAEVSAQIRAAKDAGQDEFILWDPLVTYTREGMQPDAPPVQVRSMPERKPRAAAAKPPMAARGANELGAVPVLMFHQIREDGGGDYDLTPAEFRETLEQLRELGYLPITASQYVRGQIDLPAGKSPVVMTFDDSTKEQLSWTEDREARPNTAVGIMLDFAEEHPDWKPAGTFYVNREPFAGVAEGEEMLRWLHDNGFEIGNHTYDHLPFNEMDAKEVQRQLVRGKRYVEQAVPGAEVVTMALPLGVMPDPPELALRGRWGGESYRHLGVMLVGAEPAPSPFSKRLARGAIPRINACRSTRQEDFCWGFWAKELAKPGRRYVSDGDPSRLTFPRERLDELPKRLRGKANPY